MCRECRDRAGVCATEIAGELVALCRTASGPVDEPLSERAGRLIVRDTRVRHVPLLDEGPLAVSRNSEPKEPAPRVRRRSAPRRPRAVSRRRSCPGAAALDLVAHRSTPARVSRQWPTAQLRRCARSTPAGCRSGRRSRRSPAHPDIPPKTTRAVSPALATGSTRRPRGMARISSSVARHGRITVAVTRRSSVLTVRTCRFAQPEAHT